MLVTLIPFLFLHFFHSDETNEAMMAEANSNEHREHNVF